MSAAGELFEVPVAGLAPTPLSLAFRVLGQAAPKGSSRAVAIKGKDGKVRAVNVPSGDDNNKARLKSWDTAVREAAIEAVALAMPEMVATPPFVGEPIRVELVFRVRRPAGHFGKRGIKPGAPAFPWSKPDIDKLARATLDSMTGIVFDDDGRIAELVARKVWAGAEPEGATIRVEAMR